jgi:hypothetical protein
MSYVRALLSTLGAIEGRARRLAHFRHFHAEREPLFLVCWRPGGEDGRAAALAFAHGRREMKTIVAGDPRNWRLQAEMLQEFALEFNSWFERFASIRVTDGRNRQGEERRVAHAAPQIVIANDGTRSFIQRLAQFIKTLPETLRTPELERLAQHLEFLFEMSGSPGQSFLVVMTEVLSFHYAIPLTSAERQSLSACAATISHARSHYEEALTEAEEIHFGPLPGAHLEREIYQLVSEFNAKRGDALERSLVKPLLRDLEREYKLLSGTAMDVLRESFYREAVIAEAASTQRRRMEDRRRYTLYVDWMVTNNKRRSLAPNPWRAFRWIRRMEEDASVFAAESACDDAGLMTEHLSAGSAMRGTVVKSDAQHSEPGRARKTVRPLLKLRIEADTPPPSPGQEFWLSSHPRGKAWEVREVKIPTSGQREVTLVLTTAGRNITLPAAGVRVTFVSFSAARGVRVQLPKTRPRAFGG